MLPDLPARKSRYKWLYLNKLVTNESAPCVFKKAFWIESEPFSGLSERSFFLLALF